MHFRRTCAANRCNVWSERTGLWLTPSVYHFPCSSALRRDIAAVVTPSNPGWHSRADQTIQYCCLPWACSCRLANNHTPLAVLLAGYRLQFRVPSACYPVVAFPVNLLGQVSTVVKLDEALSYLDRSFQLDPWFENFDRIAEPLFLEHRRESPGSAMSNLNVAIMQQSKLYCRTYPRSACSRHAVESSRTCASERPASLTSEHGP